MPFKIEAIEHTMHKGGKFIFSCDCDRLSVLLLDKEAQTLYKSLKKIPIVPTFFADLEPDLIRRSIFGTAAIEGNPLSVDEVSEVMQDTTPLSENDVLRRAEQEIKNLTKAYDILKSKSDFFAKNASEKDFFVITEDFCKGAHKFITKDIKYNGNIAGYYRNIEVKVGDQEHGGTYVPPRTLDDIKTLMSIFIEWINSDAIVAMGPFIRAALAHYYIALIHPFQDGNGRTARFLEASILRASGISFVPFVMSNYYYLNIDAYFSVFSSSRKQRDMTPFLEFFFKGVISSLEDIEEKSFVVIKPTILKDFIQFNHSIKLVTKRQYELLNQLLDCKKDFTPKDLFTTIPFKYIYRDVTESTAKRDIKKLLNLNFLQYNEGKYGLNYAMLDNTTV